MSNMRLLIATENGHKLHEILELMADLPQIQLVSLRDYPDIELPPETGSTMRENALIKAEFCARATGLPAIADDSGIEVDALNGEPGLYSARWFPGSDADRTQAVLNRLKDVPDEQRTARYRCAVCLARVDAERQPVGERSDLYLAEVEATCEGRITHAFRGEHGFGYDPIFEITPATGAPQEWVCYTLGEVPPELKAQISHRARAIEAIKPYLIELFQKQS